MEKRMLTPWPMQGLRGEGGRDGGAGDDGGGGNAGAGVAGGVGGGGSNGGRFLGTDRSTAAMAKVLFTTVGSPPPAQ